jgi:DnaJ-class molecular chaperone
MADFNQIDKARKVLGLQDYASLDEIKESYRQLSLKYHPDKCKEEDKKDCEKIFKEINQARDILVRYCSGYRYSFKEKDVERNRMDKDFYKHLKRFYDGWWADLDI